MLRVKEAEHILKKMNCLCGESYEEGETVTVRKGLHTIIDASLKRGDTKYQTDQGRQFYMCSHNMLKGLH